MSIFDTDSMVERVAATLFDREHNGLIARGTTSLTFGRPRITYAEVARGVQDGVWADNSLSAVRATARAAIAAMREPTEAMDAAGSSKKAHGPEFTLLSIWRAMIDAALREPA